MIIDLIHKRLEENHLQKDSIKIGYIKEVLQSELLQYIYRNNSYKNLVFYGGTAMRFLLGLNRLSEDLDFIGKGFTAFEQLGIDLQQHFKQEYNSIVDYKIQKFRITLNFKELLSNFNLEYGNSKDLYLKIEISDHFDFCKNYTLKYYPVLYQNKNILVYSLDESSLFATKLNAVLYRQRAKNKNNATITVKGRDFYDLFWYLQKGIQPNIACIKGVASMEELKQKLYTILDTINFKEVILDIENFVEDDTMIPFIQNHGKEYMIEKVQSRK